MPLYNASVVNFLSAIQKIAPQFRVFYVRSQPSQITWKQPSSPRLFWQEYSVDFDAITFDHVRAQDPLKQFFLAAKEKVVADFSTPTDAQKPLLLLGAKNCDLTGLDISDFVFMQGRFQDPFYITKREAALIVASDCSDPLETCFCTALGHHPYPEKNYDIGVTALNDGLMIDVVTERAARLLNDEAIQFEPATKSQLAERDQRRQETTSQVEQNCQRLGIPNTTALADVLRHHLDDDLWQEEVQNCVECGCCNVVCPTCHCFFLSDSKTDNHTARYKAWDACLYKDFARVAGGGNPRLRLAQRLRNRFDKKFRFFPDVLGQIACTGCGRCYAGCPADIDIRSILKRLVHQTEVAA